MAAGLAVAVTLAACSPGGDSDPGAVSDTTIDAGGRAEDFGLTEDELVAAIDATEAAIASCMSDTGFDYVPVDAVSVREAMTAVEDVPGLADEDYPAQFGYGISTVGDTPVPRLLGDVNSSYYAGLPPGEQSAFDSALLGEDPTASFFVTLDDEDFSSVGGCTRTGIELVFDESELTGTYANPVDAQIDADPRVVAAQEAWVACMREAGYDYQVQEEAEDELRTRFDAITGGVEASELTAGGQALITALQGEEKAIAVADFRCAEENYEPVVEKVEEEITGRAGD